MMAKDRLVAVLTGEFKTMGGIGQTVGRQARAVVLIPLEPHSMLW